MNEVRTIKARVLDSTPSTFFGSFDVPETASNYRVLVHRGGGSVSIALLNWETSCEYGHLPTNPSDSYSLAEHLTNDNLVDARNLIDVFCWIAGHWQKWDAT